MDQNIATKLADAGVKEDAIAILIEQEFDTEASLLAATVELLQVCGIKAGACVKIKAAFPSPVDAAAPAESAGNNGIVGAISELAGALADKDSVACPHCGKKHGKDFAGDFCTSCGKPMKQSIVCIKCGHANEHATVGGYCTKCGTQLLDRASREQIAHLCNEEGMKVGAAIRELRDLRNDPVEYERFKAKVDLWVEQGGNTSLFTQGQGSGRRYSF